MPVYRKRRLRERTKIIGPTDRASGHDVCHYNATQNDETKDCKWNVLPQDTRDLETKRSYPDSLSCPSQYVQRLLRNGRRKCACVS